LKLPTPAAQRAATVPDGPALAEQLARWPTFIGFYVGRADQRFLGMNEAFDKALRNAGVAHVFRTYAGGHSATLWASQVQLAGYRAGVSGCASSSASACRRSMRRR
jgi:enterochelin esterase-like enzyme